MYRPDVALPPFCIMCIALLERAPSKLCAARVDDATGVPALCVYAWESGQSWWPRTLPRI